MEKNTHGIHSIMDFKEKCKLIFSHLIVLKYEYHFPDIYLIMNDIFLFLVDDLEKRLTLTETGLEGVNLLLSDFKREGTQF